MRRAFGCVLSITSVPSLPLNSPLRIVFSCRSRYSSSLGLMFRGGCSSNAGFTRTFFILSASTTAAPSESRYWVTFTFIPYVMRDISGARSSSSVPLCPASSGSPKLGGSWRCVSRTWSLAVLWMHAFGRSWFGTTNVKGKVYVFPAAAMRGCGRSDSSMGWVSFRKRWVASAWPDIVGVLVSRST